MKPIAIFAATRWEFDALRRAFPEAEPRTMAGVRCLVGKRGGQACWLVQTGIGFDRARKAARSVLAAESFGLAVSSGFACALSPAQVGDLLVATEVAGYEGAGPFDGERVRSCSGPDTALVLRIAADHGFTVYEGRFLSVPRVVCRASDKRALSALTGAVGLDMESAPLAEAAFARGVPLIVVRTVSDLADEDLPLDFNLFLSPGGWAGGVLSCLTRPSSWVGLARLRSQSKRAAAHLSEFFLHYPPSLVRNGSPSWG